MVWDCFECQGMQHFCSQILSVTVHPVQPIAPPRVDSSKGPNRVNRAHWPTKENMQTLLYFWICSVHGKWPGMAPNGSRRICWLLIQTFPTFWAERILILWFFIYFDFLDPKFLDFQVPRSPNSQISRSPDFQTPPAPAPAGAGRIFRSQPDPSPNAPRDQIRRKVPCYDFGSVWFV